MTVTTKKSAGKVGKAAPKRGRKNSGIPLPPSADVVEISGREYIIAPLDEYRDWEEERALAALMRERINDGDPLIPFEEFESRLDRKNRRKGK